jgi:hypothetical protein|tara:strand:+ start:321 stop:449 length:129 start_codon:yes stop_codon:yes gene_type:complete
MGERKMKKDLQDKPEYGKTYSLLEISKGKTWKESEVKTEEKK